MMEARLNLAELWIFFLFCFECISVHILNILDAGKLTRFLEFYLRIGLRLNLSIVKSFKTCEHRGCFFKML